MPTEKKLNSKLTIEALLRPTEKEQLPLFVTTKEFADLVRIHPNKVYKIVQTFDIGSFRMGGRLRIPTEAVKKMVQQGLSPGEKPPKGA